MELDNLKDTWRELDERLDRLDRRIDTLTASVVSRRIVTSRERLQRINRLLLVPLSAMPLAFANLFRYVEPPAALAVSLGIFLLAMFVRQILLLVLIERIRPERQTVRELGRAVLRLRRCFLWGVVVGIALAIPPLGLLAWRLSQLAEAEFVLWGFATGLVCGIALGVQLFLRIYSEIETLRDALRDE